MAYSQRDPAWRNILLGFNTSSLYTIGTSGCYVTAIANVCKWAGHDFNPQQINDICKDRNWFVDGGLISRDDIPALLCSNLGYTGRTNWTGPTDMNFFNDASSPDVAYIIEIDASKAPGIQTHFTMVWSKPDATDLEIDDSWDGVRRALSHYGSPSAVILSAMRFVRVAPPPAPAPIPPLPSPAPPPTPPPLPTPVIAPPVVAPSREVYPIKVNIPKYSNMTDAQNMKNATGTLSASPANYYAFNTLNGVVSITTQPGVSQGIWINPAQNVVQPVPPIQVGTSADVMKTWKWGYPTHEPAEYKIVRNYIVNDLIHNGHSIDIKAGHNIDIYGSFVMNGTTYLRPLTSVDDKGLYYWYGIPTTNIHTGEPYLLNEYNVTDIIQERWESFYDRTIRIIESIFRLRKK